MHGQVSYMNIKWGDERNKPTIKLIKNELLIYINMNIQCRDSYSYFVENSFLILKARTSNKYTWKNKYNKSINLYYLFS